MEEKFKHTFNKNYRHRIDIKVVTSAVFLVTYRNKRSTCKASYALWFLLRLSVFNRFVKN